MNFLLTRKTNPIEIKWELTKPMAFTSNQAIDHNPTPNLQQMTSQEDCKTNESIFQSSYLHSHKSNKACCTCNDQSSAFASHLLWKQLPSTNSQSSPCITAFQHDSIIMEKYLKRKNISAEITSTLIEIQLMEIPYTPLTNPIPPYIHISDLDISYQQNYPPLAHSELQGQHNG